MSDPCVMVLFGASGDLTRRLLMPALYNLACDGLLPKRFALLGVALDELTTDAFRERMSRDIREFSTRRRFDDEVWGDLERRLSYLPAFDLIERDGRTWLEVVNRGAVETVPLFQGCDAIFQHHLTMVLQPEVVAADRFLIRKGEVGRRMYFLLHGEVDVVDGEGRVINTLGPGSFFGEMALLLSEPRTASIRTRRQCDLLALDKADFNRVLRDHPEFARPTLDACRARYRVTVAAEQAFDRQVTALME